MDKKQIREELQKLQVKMRSIAECMMWYKKEHWLRHGVELSHAANVIDNWLEGIEEEMEAKNVD
jgi:hypothetical protein